jgi:low temperature requirement protein LtrA
MTWLPERSGRDYEMPPWVERCFSVLITQLSHHLAADPTAGGLFQALLLLAMVWLVWVYTAWITNWLNPDHMAVRLLLLALMLASLVLSAALPRACQRPSCGGSGSLSVR